MSLADTSPAVTLLSAKKRYSIHCPKHEQEGQVVHQVFESPAANQTRRKRSQEVTPPILTSSSRSGSPDDPELCLSSSVLNPCPSTLIRDISLEEELQSKVLHLVQEVAVLKNTCNGQHRENLKLSQTLLVYQQECQAVVDSLKEVYGAKMEQMEVALAKSAKAREDVQSEKSALEAAFKQMLEISEKEKGALKAELEQTKLEYDKVLRSITRTEAQLARTEKTNSQLQRENEELRKEVESLKKQKEVDDRSTGNKLKESEMRNGFYEMLFEVAVNKVKYVEERQQQQQQPQQSQSRVFSPDSTSSTTQEARSPTTSSGRQGAAIPRSGSYELLQILHESIQGITNKSSADTQSMNSFLSGDSEGHDSERLDSADAERLDSKDSEADFRPPPTYVRGHSEPNILSPFFLHESDLPTFEFNSPNESDETCSMVSMLSSEHSDFLSLPNSNMTSSPKPAFSGRRGARRAPLLKSFTVDDPRLTPPRLKFRSNTDFDQSEEISLDNDYVIINSSTNGTRDDEDLDYASIASQDAEVKSSSRSGFKVLKQRRNGITDMDRSFPPRVAMPSQPKAKKSKGRELADIFRKFTSGGDGDKHKGKLSRKRSKSVKEGHIAN